MTKIKNISTVLLFLAGAIFNASAETRGTKGKKVPYKIAERYFVKNTLEDGIFLHPHITSQEELEKWFGMATVMGKKGSPTPVDFSSQYVIAVIDSYTEGNGKLEVKSLLKKEGVITLTYDRVLSKENTTNSMRYCLLLIVNKKHGEQVRILNAAEEEPIPFRVAKRYFVSNEVKEGELFFPKIETKEAFDQLFGSAPVMGEDGQPTPIDFSTQYALAIINPTSPNGYNFEVKSLVRKNGVIALNYTKKEEVMEQSTARFRWCFILIVDKKYQGDVTFHLQN